MATQTVVDCEKEMQDLLDKYRGDMTYLEMVGLLECIKAQVIGSFMNG